MVASGLLLLAKGNTPDSGDPERPISPSRLQPMLVLPHTQIIIIITIIIIIISI